MLVYHDSSSQLQISIETVLDNNQINSLLLEIRDALNFSQTILF
jgi:hypothetical protein